MNLPIQSQPVNRQVSIASYALEGITPSGPIGGVACVVACLAVPPPFNIPCLAACGVIVLTPAP
jgi:hypothetical protein